MPWMNERARLAALSRCRADDDPAVQRARAAYRAARAEDYIKRLVEEAPPLTDEQLDRLALLLRPRGDAA